MRRARTPLSLVLVLTGFAAACGDDDDSTTTAGSDDAGDQTDLEDVTDEPDDEPADEPDDEPLPIGGGPYPIADIFVFYSDGAGNTADYRLACLGDTATFTGDVPDGVDAATACLSLASDEARALLSDPAVGFDRMGTEGFGGPEVANVGGLLDDVEVDFEINRINGCGIDDWDRVFAGLVPPAGAVGLLGKGGAVLILIQLLMAVTTTGSAERIAVSSHGTYDLCTAST